MWLIVSVASSLFSLSYNWSLWRCFVLLLGEIQFFSKGFPFLAMSRSFLLRFCQFCRLKYPYSFFPHFCFFVIIILLIFMLSMLFLVAVISLSLLFFMYPLSQSIDISTLSSVLVCPLPPSFLNTYNLSMSSLWCKALIFLCGLLIDVLPLSTSRKVVSIFKGGQPRCLSLCWDLCYVVWFRVVLLFS